MAKAPCISVTAAIAMCDQLVDLLDAGAGAGLCDIYTTPKPADVSVGITSQTLLGTLTFSDPAFGSAVDNTEKATATANAITSDTNADANGTAVWFRAKDSNGVAIFDGTVGDTGSDFDMIINSVNVSAGGTISCSAMTVSVPEK